jgi:neutral ceramidase
MHLQTRTLLIGIVLVCLPLMATAADKPVFRAGAFAVDITPLELPVIVNGGMSERVADKIEDRLHARCIVLDDGKNMAAIVVVDSCMIPRELLDEAKELARKATGIPTEHMLISATHTHSAPSVHGCLGSDPDEKYARFLPPQIAKGIAQAKDRLQPARIGWGVGRDEKNVACRHWEMKPGIAPTNPFGGTKDDTVMMHPGFENPNKIRATGPTDPEVPVLSLQTPDGKPLAVLTNYSLHYVGAPAVSADYFALVCEEMRKLVGAEELPNFMAAHSNATSGDMWLMDYTKPQRMFDRQTVAKEVSAAAYEAYAKIKHYDWVPLVMAENKLTLKIRKPTAEEVEKATEFVKTFEGRKPKTVPEVYARETLLMHAMPPTRELKLQAIRLGDLGIAAIPNETYASTGLFIKANSPLKTTMCIELANGCEGYIPPEDLHKLGGYTTWRARTSCLQVDAEEKIRDQLVKLLKQVASERQDEAAVPAK